MMKYGKWMIGGVIGAAVGFAYWYFVGCNSGSCAITSSPVNSTLYGLGMGMLTMNMFTGDRKKNEQQKNGK